MKYNVLDLFAGMGGFALGFKSTKKFDIKLANDIWEPARDTYVFNNPETPFILGDIKDLTEEQIFKYFHKVDVIIGGPPCQGFSMCGTRDIHDERNKLFYEYVRIVNITKPYVFVLENVKGILSMKSPTGEKIIDIIREEFEKCGYNLHIKLLNAKNYEVPQSRERIIIVGTRNDLKNDYEFPLEINSNNNLITLEEAFKNLDELNIENHDIPVHKKEVSERMAFVPQGGNWQNIPENFRVGGIHSNSYRRLSLSQPSITIKHAYKSMIIHPTEDRCLSIREVCRIQSFPDSYICKNSKTSQYQQLANAVPPKLAEHLALSIDSFLKKNLSLNSIKNENTLNKFKFIDLFAGLGGFRIAFEKNNAECVFSSEIDKYACETYFNNFKEYPKGDITKIESKEIPNFDILCAGFPCQPFSIGGLRKGFEDSRGTLFFEVARILKEKQPSAFILENVKGIVSHDNKNTLKVIEEILDEIGYNFQYKILNAKDYGIPQNRERWYCIGFKKELNITFGSQLTLNKNSKIFQFPQKTDLEFKLEDIVQHNISGYQITAKAKENINKHLPLFKEKNEIISTNYILVNEIRPSRCNFKNDGTVPCFTAKMGTGGNNIPVIVDFERKLTEKECLKLMGFPDDYKIKPNYHQSYKQIGNSVVVSLIQKLASEIIKVLS